MLSHKEIVCDSDAVTGCHCVNFLFAAAIKCCPRYAVVLRAPVKERRVTLVAHKKLAAYKPRKLNGSLKSGHDGKYLGKDGVSTQRAIQIVSHLEVCQRVREIFLRDWSRSISSQCSLGQKLTLLALSL